MTPEEISYKLKQIGCGSTMIPSCTCPTELLPTLKPISYQEAQYRKNDFIYRKNCEVHMRYWI